MIKKIILSTDIADDIDDAYALDYLLQHPEDFNLLGVITVYKNVRERALIAKKIIRLNNCNVPVYMGNNNPLVEPVCSFPYEKNNHLLSYKESLESEKIEQGDGIEFILKTIKENPHEIILVGIGALTDIATAIQKDPDTMKLVKEIVLMNGSNDLVEGRKEWNVMCDPEACKIVYGFDVPLKTVPYQITCQSEMSDAELEESYLANRPAAKYICEMAKEWMEANKRNVMLHDVIPLCLIRNPDYFKVIKADVSIPLEKENRGRMDISLNNKSKKEIVSEFSREKFMNDFMKTFKKGETK